MGKLGVILFGLPGLAHAALRGAADAGAEVQALITRRYEGKFPYYDEEPLADLAARNNVPVLWDRSVRNRTLNQELAAMKPDVLLVATFDQVLPPSLIRLPSRCALNLHPGVLPAYAGATPTFWVLVDGHPETALTVHYLVAEMDAGAIVEERRCPIRPTDTDGRLRRRLATVCREVVCDLLRDLARGRELKVVRPPVPPRFVAKRRRQDARLLFNVTAQQVLQRTRAAIPYPWPFFVLNGQDIRVVGFDPEIYDADPNAEEPGEITSAGIDRWVTAKCKSDSVVLELDPEGWQMVRDLFDKNIRAVAY